MTQPILSELSPAKRALREARLRGRYQEAPILPRAGTEDAPLSPAQERLWFVDRMFPGRTVYTLVAALRLPGMLDEAVLERAMAEVVRRHDVLRTTFREVNGAPVQVIAPFTGFALPVEDLSTLPAGARDAEVRARVARERAHVFDLETGPLFRASLLRLDAGEHVLLLCIHHIICDAWSMGVFERELSMLYDAYREGWDSPLAPLPVQYADYAAWQRAQPPAAEERHLAYWRRQLAGAPELLELPTDRPRTPAPSFRGAQVPLEAPLAVLDRLRALATAQGATLHMVLMSAFQVLLARYAGTPDVSTGIAVLGRSRREVEGLIGIFVNTLVLRTDLSGDPAFRAVVGRVREAALDAYQHQDVPFERVVAEVRPQRSLSHSALFQVQFQLDESASTAGAAGPPADAGGLRPEPFASDPADSTQVDLTLMLQTHASGLSGSLEYATDLFDEATVRRMARHLERVLEQVAENADVRLSQLELLGGAEREQVLGDWNRTERLVSDPPAHALFAEWARRAPDAVALLDGGEAVTYGALDRRAAVLARHLRELGVGPETPVGLCMERTPELLVGVLGIWKAGGAYVPLDPSYPAERLAWIIADAALPVVVATGRTAGALPEHGAALVRVDQLAETSQETEPEVTVSDAGLAYVIYTSGSTGRPKGVLVRHGSLSNLLAATREAFGAGQGDVMPALASYAFDIWLFEALLPLTSGAAVRLVGRERVLDVPALVEEIADATLVHAVPALMRQVVQSERETPRLARLRRAFVGGDRVPADLLAEMREALPQAETHVLYGPTEGTILASTHPVPEDGIVEGHPIGRPLGNVRLYVCDLSGSPQPAGVPGELLIGGAGVARGYLGRAGLTAERFVPDAFGGEPGARLYRTGDRARWRADGTLEYLGRTDFQVKVRGFRVEPGEIEGALRRSEGVADCVVVAREDVPGETRLVAYVVGTVEANELREHLLRELPEYMVPAAFVPLEALPLTPNGKLDRKALPAPEGDAYARRSYEAPLGEVEEALAGIWAEVLGVERVGRWDHFFELGGHSLLAIRLLERMRRAGLHMEVRALFATPVLAELALSVGQASQEVEVPPNAIPEACESITPGMLPLVELTQGEIDRIVGGVPDGAANVQDIYPLAPLQEGIHFHHLLSREGDPYLTPSVIEFDTRARLDRFLAALQAVIDRHDILRTAVAWDGLREPVQVVWRHAPLPVEEVELDGEAGAAEQQLWARYDPRHYRMDVTRAPLLRAVIAEDRAQGRWLLLMLTHHLTSDHETMGVLLEELAAHLQGRERELPAPLPFRNYVARARLGVSREEHERFFRGLLGDVEEPTAPYGVLDVWGEGHGLEEAWLPVDHDLGARLRQRARTLGVSAASLCHLAWAMALSRLTGRRDVVFGTLLFGRMQGGEGADRVMGPFINTLPVRIDVGAEGAEAAVRRTHALLADLLRHEHASLALAQRSSGVAAPAPLFTSLLNYRYSGGANRSQEEEEDTAEGMRGIRAEERTNYPVGVSVDDLGEGFSLEAQVVAPADAERVCRIMHTALERLVDALEVSPGRAIGSIDVLPEAERALVLEAWNGAAAEVPAELCVHELFEAQAARTPDAVAVRFEAESLTYRELNAAANRLARRLRAAGVRPEAPVGVMLERSAELVVALMAVLKSGGAYLPLDPALPAARRAALLADAGAAVLVTRGSGLEGFAGAIVSPAEAAGEDGSGLGIGVPAGALAYIIYTSGSTGRPKGVGVAHAEAAAHFLAAAAAYGLTPADRMLHFSAAGFDVSLEEMLAPLVAGACVVMRGSEVPTPLELARRAVEQGITVFDPPTAYWHQLVADAPALELLARTARLVIAGGEAMSLAAARDWAAGPAAGVQLMNGYGPTEAVVTCTAYEVPSTLPEGAVHVPIGRPLAGRAAYVLDARMQPAPLGVRGELCIGGTLARGYLGRPAATAAAFAPDPFSPVPGARMYRTGDMGRWRADGTLEFLGRTDFQVKIRGYRIELGEIEAALLEHEGVRECAVLAREEAGEKRLVAYVVGAVEADELRAHLRRSLPEHMVPSAFVGLDALPLTPNGKLDRKALPAPEAASAEKYVAPRTPVEEVLAGIWAEVLRLERVGVTESFFDLGGHSLLATQVVSRVRAVFSVELPLRALFEARTVAELAGRVEEMRRAELPVLPRVGLVERTGALSFAQERLWFMHRMEPESAVYNMHMARRLEGALDPAALERALGEIVRRHEVLRTTFAEVDGSPVQVVAPFGGFVLPVEDLSGLGEADREAALARRDGEEAQRPFALAAGPLFRAALLRLGEEDHVLLLSMHHIVSDGWSMGVLFRELSVLYEAYREGRESPLPELAVQYADYAAWQREQLEGEAMERQLSYWRERLAGAPELLELPTDHPRPAVQTYRGATVLAELSTELLERLQALARSEGATLYMTLLGAFQVLLGRYAGSDDVVVGSPIAGRTHGEVEELIGFFVNTLVLRADLSGDPSFRQVLRQAREVTLGAYEHQEVPFERLVAELQPERSLSHSPLFQVMFQLQNAEGQEGALAGLEVNGVGEDLEIAKFDLSLTLVATPQGLRGGVNYSTDLFERGTIERMLGHLERVLEQVSADADVRLSQLELLSAEEREQVVDAWNRTEAEVPADRCIHELFEAQAARTPEAVAVVFEEESLTYAQLNARANRLAHYLRGRGVGPEVRVGVLMERGLEMVAALLAVLKAGGAYVPLDPAYPAERLALMLADSASSVLLTQEKLRGLLAAEPGVRVVVEDQVRAEIAAGSAENVESRVAPRNLAYLIYTSGSTGIPKGVAIEHESAVAMLAWAWGVYSDEELSGMLASTSISFDLSVYELFLPLVRGGRVVVAENALALARSAAAGEVRLINTVPSAIAALLKDGAIPAGVRTVNLAGEPLRPELVDELYARGGIERVYDLYGPSEDTTYSTFTLRRAGGPASIGTPISNTRAYVLGAGLRPVPVGVPGELYLGGSGVTRGYLGRPGLTAERYVPDPFSPAAGARMYRTGDRIRWKADGTLEYLGRLDHQVKVRGFRIEPGEIEAVLRRHEGVAGCVVVAREDVPGEKRLVAYVVGGAEAGALRAHLRRSLPDHMLPSAFVLLDALPLTPNGKLDRRALPAPELASAEDRYVAPRTPVEEVLAGIWAKVLGLDRAGVTESFFELGGHSLLATRVVSRIRELFGVELPLRALFEGPTVAELAARIEAERRAGEGDALPPLVPVSREAPLPLSFAQERLWFLHQMEPGDVGYNMPWPGRMWGHLDAAALERALGELVRRHESLRTTFRPVEQGAVQVVHSPAPAYLPVVDLTGLAAEEREDEARRLAREDAERPFDLQRGPLLRATLVRLADEDHVLLLTMHHIVSDGWSMGVIFRELFTLYDAFSRGSESPLPPLALQYADFAVWQRGWLRGEVLRRQLDWWRERLGGAPPVLELPTDRPRPAVASSRGGSLMFRLPAEIAGGLHSLARREGATLYMVTHAALDLLLSRWSGQEDLVVGSPIAGRTQVGTEGMIGFFVNTLALRVDLSGDPTFGELLARVRETALGAYAHQELPFERLVEEVAPERGLSHTPLFQVMFALQNLDASQGKVDAGPGPDDAGLRLEPFGGEIRTVRFDLELDLQEVGEEMFGSLRFRSDLFDAATMERFAAQYQALLDAVRAAPEERLSRLRVLPAEEARTLLAYGSSPAPEDAGGVPVHLLFTEQAARTPNAPAILFAGESLTYAELDARANRLALELRSRGVQAGTTVAVCVERGPGVLVAPLGVWKAGGVYLPLDPSYPAERLSFLLSDSGASHVLTESAVADVLPQHGAEVVLLDAIPSPPEGAGEGGALAAEVQPGDLAYLIYTSGSTGTPKAVMVEHAQLTHTLSGALGQLGFVAGDVVAALASTAFDISLLELVTPLLAGGAVRILPREVARDPEALVETVADVSVLHAVPALMRQVVETARGGGMLPSLRLLLVGGDTVPPDLLGDMREVFPDARTVVLYGPTEAAIICATYAVPADGAVEGHPLGSPLPGVRLRVCGPRGELAPLGVPGELWISGGGVARGYLGRPELNAEKFVSVEGERAYRTGDRARWRTDGVLEFLGRADEQVKVRGFRIEPGEVEAVLRGQPGVREAVVLAREDAPGDRRLVAYVVPGAEGVETAAGGGEEQVSEWETLFDDTYADDEGEEDPTLQLKGWNSSYTGEPIPREEMRAWVEHTAERILALRPEQVLEIGSGTGLLLFRVAPHVELYHGTDFSGVALAHVRRHLAGLPQVTLSEREADELADFAGAGFDTVVINSVAQYFPDVDYLLRVVEGAAAALRPGGRIFVGDVRSLPLAGAFHASVELARAPDDLPAGRLLDRVRRGIVEEQELLLDPALFEALRARMPRLGRVEVQVKRGEYDNEVSRFRYDVVLHLDAGLADAADPTVRDWGGEDAARLRALAAETSQALLVRGVPDARVREHVRAYELVAAGGETGVAAAVRALAAEDAGGIAPEALFALGEEMGREIEVRPGASGMLDVLFHPAGGVSSFPAAVDAEQPWEAYANDPQWGRRVRALVPALREAARARLPEYMVPSAFVVLESFPVTANGKVDRGALPAPDTLGTSGGTYVAPRTPAEERMAGIWAEVLGVERVGGDDNFFDLGGHSLLATQLVSRVREVFQTELPLRAVFEAPTLAELAGRVEALLAEASGDAGAPPLVPVPRDGSPLPLSFAQQRLWFIEQLEPGSTAYHMPSALRLRGPLDARVLERALDEVVRRHEALRTTFGESEGVPFQVVHPTGAARLEVTDLSGLAEEEREAEALRLAAEEAERPFDLRAGPLFRTRLLRLAEDDHVLVLAMHHVVSDGWSMGVLDRELGALYEAFARGEPSPLPELPVQYADFAVWQRAWLEGEVMERQISWWRERLAGAPPVLELPTDRPRPATAGPGAAHVFRMLPPETAEGVRALARREGATLYMVLLAALDLLLARWSGQDDVVVGTPIANRTRRETEGLIGFFVNTLALRADVSGNPRLSELLGRVRETTLGAYQHQDVPFERLVDELRVERSLSHTPLFQVMFSLIEGDGAGGTRPFGGLEVEPYGAGAGAAKFDLDVMVVEREGELGIVFTWREELWDASTLERLAGAYALLLGAAAADASRRVLDIPLMADAERQRLLGEWNAAPADFPRKCIHELFAEQAGRTPEAVALVSGDETLTYAELRRRSDALARRLAALGVGPEVRVGICVERGVEMVVGILGILKAGGAYVPLDPQYPAERLAYMLADSGATLLLAQERLRDRLPAFGGEVLLLDSDAGDDAPGAEPRGASPENLAYVIYTSGSTGLPKGTEVPHRAIPGFFRGADYARFGEGAVVLQHSSVSWDALTLELWPALLSGGTCVLYPGQTSEPGLLGEQVRRHGVNTLWLTAAYFNLIVDTAPEILDGVSQVMTGGEAVSVPHVRRALELYPRLRLVNGYGPSETTVFATCYPVPADFGALSVPLGRPVGDRRVYLLDGRGEPVPEGVAGELCIGGPAVARGYLARPALTAERFIPDPFGEPGARLYRSGDRARWRAEGGLEFVGRTDFQVKIRGFRVEPGEIEAVLRAAPGMREAAVVVREDQPGDRRLVAYVAGEATADELREQLRERLPEHMVPSAFVFLDALPLTPNGKLDRRALPAPELASPEEAYVAPRTPAEEVLAGIWAELLRLERVGAEASFFDLGGHSLLATRLTAHIRQAFGVELPLRAVFERPVLSALAAEIERLRGTGTAAGEGAIAPAARGGDLPVTFAQERLWFVDALDPGSPVYAIPSSYVITGALDTAALRRALAELVRRHEPLRTTLPAVDGVPVQRIAPPPAGFDLPVADLRHLPEDERRPEAVRLAAEASQHRFDLARGPLFRASLVHVDDAEHLLLLNLHHAIGDGWTMGVLLEELSALYGAFSRGEPSPLPEPALQYADYAVWQRERLSGAELERQVEFWRQALDGAPALLELPTDRPRPPVESHRGATEHLVVSSDLTAEVNTLARREGATLFMVLLAALDVVLGRLAGQEDVVVGTPIAGRTRAETDRMVGLFLNSLALRTDLSGDPSFRELLGRVRETTLSAYAHQDLPFERVLEEVHPERSLAHAPVFQVMLNLLNFQDGELRAEGLEVAGGGTGGELASKFDLTLYVGERDGTIDVNLIYAADLFGAPRMRELLAQLEGVLRQAAAAPETRVGALSLATEAARGVLPDPARPIRAEAWRGAVHETFAARAAERPDALAISDAAGTWTYAALDAAANRIAHRLIDGGVRPGDVVAVYAHRSAALVRALLGAWKAGAAFAILDPAYPSARLAAQASAASPTALLRISAAGEVPAEVAAALGHTARTTVVLTTDGKDGGDGFPSTAPGVSVAADDLAYVAFTSGTTGAPKAIAGTHRPLAHFFGWYARELGVGDADRVSVLSGLAHDPLLRDVFAALTVGGSIAIPDPDQVGTPGWLGGWMRDEGVTVAHLTPAMGQVLATGPGDARLPVLRLACFGGDVLRAGDVERLRAIAPNAEVVNFYGATETPQAIAAFRVPAGPAEMGDVVPIGRGIEGVDLLVVTPQGMLAGIGELGEIAVRTPYLSRGYLNDAELTAARFVPNPLTGDPADRVYRTGDLGRYRPDGNVEPVGRADQQVKVRGFRVELGEIEAALASHPAIREAAVMARETDAGDRRLAAYWVPSDEGADGPDAAGLRAHLKALLPEYMVPSAWVRLDRLPLTANGKLDRRALPEPASVMTETRAPRTATEEILAQLWAEVLRTDSVGVDDDFFALGGHSLLATRLLARVQNALGVVIPLRALFEGPTVAELAVRVEEVRRAGLPALPPVVPVGRDRPLPLSFAQERLWFIDRLEGGSAPYNIPAALRLRGALDVDALRRGLGEIVRRHESLRTIFREGDGGAVQVIAPFAGFALPIDDLSGLDPAARETEVRRRAREDAARPFDLAEGPLFRAALLRVADEEHVLLLCIHHIVTDGWSSGIFLRELSALYAAYRDGSDSPLAELPVQYADFAVWQREQLQGEVLDRQVGYWKERLAGAPALLELPTDRPRPAVQSYRGARELFDLPRALLDRLQALGRGEGATLYMVLLGAFQLLLSKYSGSEDIVVGSPIAGRTRRELEELIGFFANTLVLRTDLSADPTFRELLGRVREGTLGAYEHQEVPFERLVAELQPERSLSHSPLFQVMFTLQNIEGGGAGLAGLQMEGVAGEGETTKFDLALTALPHDGGLHGTLEYSTDLFDPSTVRRMAGHLERVLEQVSADADVPISELDLLSAEEREQVVDAWNRTAAEVPADRCIHELFEAQAARTPGAVAVVFEEESLTYAELNARANRLARYLRGRGVGPEVRVGVLMERSLEMVAALLAVLKAGGAYVPLDPAYPAERLAFMLADSATRVLLTQEKLRGLLAVEPGVQVVVEEEVRAEIAAGSAENVRSRAAPRNLAYLIYTSGSTGIPKGVAIEHESAVAMLAWAWSVFSDEELSGMLASTSLSFDMSVFELFTPLTRGGRVIVVENALGLPHSAAADQVRLLDTVPSAAAALLRSGGIPSGVKTVSLGGEPLRAELVDALYAHGVERVYDLYGPSEDTTFSTYALRRPGGPVTIGRVLSNSRAYVVDTGLRPVPVGVSGELYLAGRGVTRGYLGQPGLTAERYVPDPFGSRPGARMYRTGDRVRWKADGTLEYLGRLDHQVKVRGFRVETGEIEAVLRRHEGVADCVVVARADAGEQRLVAYVAGEAPAEALRAHVRRSLPEYMVPGAFVVLGALPLTPNGKLDRRALPAPELASAEERYVAPRTPVEEALAGIWAEVLRLERVGVEESFFELGGHSLLATRVVSQVRAVFGVELPLRAVFETSTVAGLAPQVETLVLARMEEQELADVLERLEGLSQDEVMKLLGGD